MPFLQKRQCAGFPYGKPDFFWGENGNSSAGFLWSSG